MSPSVTVRNYFATQDRNLCSIGSRDADYSLAWPLLDSSRRKIDHNALLAPLPTGFSVRLTSTPATGKLPRRSPEINSPQAPPRQFHENGNSSNLAKIVKGGQKIDTLSSTPAWLIRNANTGLIRNCLPYEIEELIVPTIDRTILAPSRKNEGQLMSIM